MSSRKDRDLFSGVRTVLGQVSLAVAVAVGAGLMFMLLRGMTEAAAETREQAAVMIAVTDLQERLLHSSDVVSMVVDPNDEHGMSERSAAPLVDHLDEGEEIRDRVEAGPGGQADPGREHPSVTDHPELASALHGIDSALHRLETTVGEGSEMLATLVPAVASYRESVLALHEAEDATDLMALYHSGSQRAENELRSQLLDVQVERGAILQSTIERSRSADRLLRTLLPVLLVLSAVALATLLARQSRRRRVEILELERESSQKDEFIATVSHELRTPLTGIFGYLELLRSPLQVSDEERDEMITIASREAGDLTNLIDDLLVIGKVDRGALITAQVPVTLQAQVAQVLEGLRMSDEIRVTHNDVLAVGDPHRVRQVIRNLVSNALKYGGPDITIHSSDAGDWAHLVVSDNGGGVPAEEVARIFQPYERAHSAAGVTGSMGLGLAVSLRLARAMNGDLSYRRVDGRTEFNLLLPRLTAFPNEPSTRQPLFDEATGPSSSA